MFLTLLIIYNKVSLIIRLFECEEINLLLTNVEYKKVLNT